MLLLLLPLLLTVCKGGARGVNREGRSETLDTIQPFQSFDEININSGAQFDHR